MSDRLYKQWIGFWVLLWAALMAFAAIQLLPFLHCPLRRTIHYAAFAAMFLLSAVYLLVFLFGVYRLGGLLWVKYRHKQPARLSFTVFSVVLIAALIPLGLLFMAYCGREILQLYACSTPWK